MGTSAAIVAGCEAKNVDFHDKGQRQTCSSIAPCRPLPAASDAFIKAPARHTRGPTEREALMARNPTGIWPDGPLPFISGHNAKDSDYVDGKASGFTVFGPHYGQDQGQHVAHAVRLGLKGVHFIRRWNEGSHYSGSGSGLVKRHRTDKHGLAKVLRKYMDYVLNDPVKNLGCCMWGFYGDDFYTHDTYKRITNRAGKKEKVVDTTAAQFRVAAAFCLEIISSYDRPGHASTFDNVKGHAKGKSRHILDIPSSDAWYHKSYLGNDILKHYGALSSQTYWGSSFWKGSILAPYNMASMRHIWDIAHRMALRDEHHVMPPLDTGKPRNILPCTWAGCADGTALPAVNNNIHRQTQTVIASVIVELIAGATGVVLYQYRSGYYNHFPAAHTAINFIQGKHGLVDAFLWGKRDSVVTREKFGEVRYVTKSPYGPNMAPWYTSARTCTGKTPSESDRNATFCPDMIVWESFNYKGARYIAAVNCVMSEAEVAYSRANTHQHGRIHPIHGQPNVCEEHLRTTFHFPKSLAGIKGTRLLVDDKGITETPVSQSDMDNGVVDVTMGSYGTVIYKFEIAEGYCGSDSGHD